MPVTRNKNTYPQADLHYSCYIIDYQLWQKVRNKGGVHRWLKKMIHSGKDHQRPKKESERPFKFFHRLGSVCIAKYCFFFPQPGLANQACWFGCFEHYSPLVN